MNSPFTIVKGGSKFETFTVKCDVVSGPDHGINLDIFDPADLEAYGTTNNFRSNNDGDGSTGTSTSDGATAYTSQEIHIEVSDLTVNVSDSNPLARTSMDDVDNIVLLEGTIKANKGAVTVDTMTVALAGSGITAGTTDYENLKVYVDGILTSEEGTLTFASTACSTDFTDTFPVDGEVPLKITIDANAAVTAKVKNSVIMNIVKALL